MISFNNHIIFDNIDTWPTDVIELLRNNENSITGFFEEEHRIDKLAVEDVSLRWNRPYNIHKEKWDIVIQKIEAVLKNHSIVGIHCTKLLDYEIKDIEKNGLKPLNKKFANQRIEKAFNKGLISLELRDKIINKKEFDAENRKGKIFVFHCLSTLKDELGLNRLFGYWGGESLYAFIENPQELKQLGIPCIVFTSIKISKFDIYPELSKRLTAFYFDDNFFPYDTDSIIKSNLNVLRIIKKDEKIFKDLTEIQNWDRELN